MKNILLVTSSPRGEMSHSTKVATSLAHDLDGELTVRELWREPIAPIGPDFVHAHFTPEADRTAAQREVLAQSDQAIAEIQAADVVVIGAAMINFGMPAVLKMWIDLITRSGVTFSYGEAGPQGLLTGKRLILVIAAGGVYSNGPMSGYDHLDSALRAVLGFLGFADIETVWIEGVAYGEDATERALSQAGARTLELAAR